MRAVFHYHAQVRQAAGAESEPVELAGAPSLEEAMAALAARHGEDFRALVLDDAGRIRPSLLVLVNGQPAARGATRPLADGDVVTLLSAMAGG
jgi:molybdopterin converting factor small subunit